MFENTLSSAFSNKWFGSCCKSQNWGILGSPQALSSTSPNLSHMIWSIGCKQTKFSIDTLVLSKWRPPCPRVIWCSATRPVSCALNQFLKDYLLVYTLLHENITFKAVDFVLFLAPIAWFECSASPFVMLSPIQLSMYKSERKIRPNVIRILLNGVKADKLDCA